MQFNSWNLSSNLTKDISSILDLLLSRKTRSFHDVERSGNKKILTEAIIQPYRKKQHLLQGTLEFKLYFNYNLEAMTFCSIMFLELLMDFINLAQLGSLKSILLAIVFKKR